jgi:hypothetical protein
VKLKELVMVHTILCGWFLKLLIAISCGSKSILFAVIKLRRKVLKIIVFMFSGIFVLRFSTIINNFFE